MTVTIEIGGMPVRVITRDVAFLHLLNRQYANFLVSAETLPHVELEVELSSPVQLSPDQDLHVHFESGAWTLQRGDFHARYDPVSRRGIVRQSASRHSIDSVIRIIHSLELARREGFLLHAASAVRNGKAFLFSGVSGAGKTTIARLAPADVKLLTDEVSYLGKPEPGAAFHAWGTPFAGELAQPGENLCAPVSALYFLEQGRENRTTSITSAEAMRLLMRNVLFFADDPLLVTQVFHTAAAFVLSVPVFRLQFLPDPRVWSLIQ